MLRILWKLLVRRVAPRQLDALAGRGGKPDWPIVLRRGVTQGFLGGSNVWIVLGGLAALIRLWQKVGQDREAVLLVDRLVRSEGISILDTGVERRNARKAGKAGKARKAGG
jgi:hypothetical protein